MKGRILITMLALIFVGTIPANGGADVALLVCGDNSIKDCLTGTSVDCNVWSCTSVGASTHRMYDPVLCDLNEETLYCWLYSGTGNHYLRTLSLGGTGHLEGSAANSAAHGQDTCWIEVGDNHCATGVGAKGYMGRATYPHMCWVVKGTTITPVGAPTTISDTAPCTP